MGKLNFVSGFLTFSLQPAEQELKNLIVSPSYMKSFSKNANFQGPNLKILIQISSLVHGSIVKLRGRSGHVARFGTTVETILPRDL